MTDTLLFGGQEVLGVLVWGLFFVVLMPAATMRLAMTGSLRGALNPTELVTVIRSIGRPYSVARPSGRGRGARSYRRRLIRPLRPDGAPTERPARSRDRGPGRSAR